MKKLIILLFTLFTLGLGGFVFADHDDRDPYGICQGQAELAASWASYRFQGLSQEELEKGVAFTPEELEKIPMEYRKLAIDATKKGLELANSQRLPQDVFVEFYDWCLLNLPKEKPQVF